MLNVKHTADGGIFGEVELDIEFDYVPYQPATFYEDKEGPATHVTEVTWSGFDVTKHIELDSLADEIETAALIAYKEKLNAI